MTPGFISGDSVRLWTPANIDWTDGETGQVFDLTRSGFFAWSRSPKLPGYLCETCGILEIHCRGESSVASSGPDH